MLIALLALVGGLPGGSGGVDLKRVLEPFPVAPAASGRAPVGSMRIARNAQETWRELFRRARIDFRPARLVPVDRVRQSACGLSVPKAAEAFYCSADSTMSFSSGSGDAYLIAHVYGHHVQELLGITDQVARGVDASPRQARDLWRRHELQADCLAGVWAHSALGRSQAASAAQIGTIPVAADHDADIPKWAAVPRGEHFRWFRRGYEHGDASRCDTYTS